RNVAHIRHKETDRIVALAAELRKLGAEVEERPDGLTITPRSLTGCAVDTYNDHRMAMSLALIGLRVPGVVIRNPGCVAKTYPGFWQDLEKLRGSASGDGLGRHAVNKHVGRTPLRSPQSHLRGFRPERVDPLELCVELVP